MISIVLKKQDVLIFSVKNQNFVRTPSKIQNLSRFFWPLTHPEKSKGQFCLKILDLRISYFLTDILITQGQSFFSMFDTLQIAELIQHFIVILTNPSKNSINIRLFFLTSATRITQLTLTHSQLVNRLETVHPKTLLRIKVHSIS